MWRLEFDRPSSAVKTSFSKDGENGVTENPERPLDGRGPHEKEEEDPSGESGMGISGKLVLTLFPFACLLLFLLLDWWFRGRS